VFAFIPCGLFAQKRSLDCSRVKDGHFYNYSKGAKVWTEVFRNGTIHKEINLTTNDTSIYRIKWLKPCSFTMELIKRTKPFEKGEKSVIESLKITIQILEVTQNYFTYKAELKSSLYQKQLSFSDTAWYKMR
jgi:hypothetical protein